VLWEFVYLLLEAVAILDGHSEVGREQFSFPIAFFVAPTHGWNDNFVISFTDEKYLGLVDFILEFTGIEPERMEVEVCGPMIFGPGITPLTPIIEESIDYELTPEPAFGEMSFQMGSRVYFRAPHWPQNTRLIDLGTLGHPRDFSGRTAFTTNHMNVPRGSCIYINGIRAGVAINPVFDFNQGIDVTYIQLEPGFSVSNRIPNSMFGIGSFFAPAFLPQQHNSVTAFGRHGAITGNIAFTGANVIIGAFPFRNMIVSYDMSALQHGDSGSALINTISRAAYGTAVGGSAGGTRYFSRATSYQHIR
jgi:hypothetical protein